MDSSTKSPNNPSTDSFTNVSTNSSNDLIMKNLTKSSCVNPSEKIFTDSFTDSLMRLHEDPLGLAYPRGGQLCRVTLSFTPGLIPREPDHFRLFDLGNADIVSLPIDFKIEPAFRFPGFEDLLANFQAMFPKVRLFVKDFCKFQRIDVNEIDNEVDRIQQILDEFGQTDPGFPPILIVEFLKLGHHQAAFNRIINWAILTNIAVDGDIRHTLLPARVVALFRDIDNQSKISAFSAHAHMLLFNHRLGSEKHQASSQKWIQLTFGLLKGGYAQFAASNEWRPGMNRIRRFLAKLLGPHFRETEPWGTSFSERLDIIFGYAIPGGYLLLGKSNRFRWEWNWLRPVDTAQRLYKARALPKPGTIDSYLSFVSNPALLLETDGYKLVADPITLMAPKWARLFDPTAQIISVEEAEQLEVELFFKLSQFNEKKITEKALILPTLFSVNDMKRRKDGEEIEAKETEAEAALKRKRTLEQAS